MDRRSVWQCRSTGRLCCLTSYSIGAARLVHRGRLRGLLAGNDGMHESVNQTDVVALDNTQVSTPEGTSWDEWFDGASVSEDFMAEREQPEEQMRVQG